MNTKILKDYYSINEACSFLSEKLNESFTLLDFFLLISEHDVKLCFYHSGFLGAADCYNFIGESLERRVPFDGVLEILHISHIQEVLEKKKFLFQMLDQTTGLDTKKKRLG